MVEMILCMIFIFLDLLRLNLWPKYVTSYKTSHRYLRRICIIAAVYAECPSYVSQTQQFYCAVHQSSMTLLIFYLVVPFTDSGVLKFLNIITDIFCLFSPSFLSIFASYILMVYYQAHKYLYLLDALTILLTQNVTQNVLFCFL